MKSRLLIVALALCGFALNSGAQSTQLGVGFGKISTISGKIMDDQDTKLRRDMGRTLIRVSKVNGKPIGGKLIVPVHTFAFADTKLPGRGTDVELRGYETGGYRGIPKEAFEDIPIVANDGYYFESHFMVTKVISPKTVEQGAPANR